MRKIIFSLLVSSALVSTTFAATIACPSNSGCNQCFGFTLGSTMSTNDIFVPRAGENETINLAASAIFAETLQGANIEPTGNIKSSFTLNAGPGTTQWTWASMNGSLIKNNSIPSSVNYDNPVYRVKYTTQSYTLDGGNQKKTGSDVTHAECAYFYATAPTPPPASNAVDGQCSDLYTYATSNPRSSSLSGEDLCDVGGESSVTYSTSRERWTYTCSGRNGGDSDSCIVDREKEEAEDCRIEVTDKNGTVPFSTSILCSGTPDGKTAIVISQGKKILDAISSDSETYDFDDSGLYTISCYPDVINDRSNVCKTTVNVSGDCGNDTAESDEQCDDGNQISGDGCNNACQTESADGALCGNGMQEQGEQCDDGNNVEGDECTSICQNTTPSTGPIVTLFIILLLSLGGAGYYFYQKGKIAV